MQAERRVQAGSLQGPCGRGGSRSGAREQLGKTVEQLRDTVGQYTAKAVGDLFTQEVVVLQQIDGGKKKEEDGRSDFQRTASLYVASIEKDLGLRLGPRPRPSPAQTSN